MGCLLELRTKNIYHIEIFGKARRHINRFFESPSVMHLYTKYNKISSLQTTTSTENPEILESNPQAYQTVGITSQNNTKTFLLEIVRIYITLVTSLLIGSRFSLSCLKTSIPSSQRPVTYLGTHYITLLSFLCTRHI